jgi:uncharacterized membrane protein YphA (DoxX/SURF4 family)
MPSTITSILSLVLRVGWSVSLLYLSGSGIKKYNAGYEGFGPTIASLGVPFSLAPKPFYYGIIFAEVICPVLLFLGLFTRYVIGFPMLHFATACYAHIFIWKQGYESLVTTQDPSGIGCLYYFIVALLISMLGSGSYSLDAMLDIDGGDVDDEEEDKSKKNE